MATIGLKDLASNVTSLGATTSDLFSLTGGTPYPETTNTIKIIDRNWNKVMKYSFKVVKSQTNTKIADGFQELPFDINPQSMAQDLSFSINITPTLGGVSVEHNSMVLSDLVISGVTGVQPGNENDYNIGLDSGYSQIHKITNYLKAYADFKKGGNGTYKDYLLIFCNKKDNEFWIVEPLKISRKKAIPKKTLYEYTIILKILSKFEPAQTGGWIEDVDNAIATAYDKMQEARMNLAKLSKTVREINAQAEDIIMEPLRQVASFVQTTKGFVNSIMNIGPSIMNIGDAYNNFAKSIGTSKGGFDSALNKKPSDSAGTLYVPTIETNTDMVAKLTKNFASSDIKNANVSVYMTPSQIIAQGEEANNINFNDIKTLKIETKKTYDKLANKIGLSNVDYNSTYAVTDQLASSYEPTYSELDALAGLKDTIDALTIIESQADTLFIESDEQRIAQIEKIYGIKLMRPKSVFSVILENNTSLEMVATKYLGSPSRWVDIMVLNGLKPPYTASTASDGVLAYGSIILIPSLEGTVGTYPVSAKGSKNESLTAEDRFLGIDILLDKNNDYVIKNNDYVLVSGVDNAKQAVMIKLGVQKGSNIYHTDFGIGIEVGDKSTEYSATELYTAISDAILADARFEKIDQLSVDLEGNTLLIDMIIKIKNINNPVPVKFRI